MSSFLSATCVNMCEMQETVSHYSSLNKTCCVSVWMSSCGQQFLSSVGLPHSSTDATTTQMQDKNSSDSICELSYLKEKKKMGDKNLLLVSNDVIFTCGEQEEFAKTSLVRRARNDWNITVCVSWWIKLKPHVEKQNCFICKM